MCFEIRINKILLQSGDPDAEHSKNVNFQQPRLITRQCHKCQTSRILDEITICLVCADRGTVQHQNVTQDQTKYDYVVSALDANTAEEIQHILVLLNPPTTGKYESLKNELNKTFGKSQFERDSELLNINGL